MITHKLIDFDDYYKKLILRKVRKQEQVDFADEMPFSTEEDVLVKIVIISEEDGKNSQEFLVNKDDLTGQSIALCGLMEQRSQ